MIPRAANCVWCGWRDAVEVGEDDGLPVCRACFAPPHAAPVLSGDIATDGERLPDGRFVAGFMGARQRMVVAVLCRMGEVCQGDIAEACGVTDTASKEYDALSAVILRMVKRGVVEASGPRNRRTYRLGVRRSPRQAIERAREIVGTLEEVTARDLADRLGVQIGTANRLLHQLEDDGLVRRRAAREYELATRRAA